MPFTPQSIATNTSEDYIDELTTGIVYKYKDYVFSGFDEKKLKTDGEDVMAEALKGASQTLQFSIMNAVIFSVTEYAMKGVAHTAIFLYLKSGRAINKVRKGFGNIPIVGKGLTATASFFTSLAIGNQEERIAMAKMANDSTDNMTTVLSQERQNQTMQLSHKRTQMLNTLGLASNNKGLRDTKKTEAYYHKMKTGSWANTTLDKNLFLSVVPREYVKQPFAFNSSFVKKLNGFTEFAKSSEDKLVNLAQAHLDNMTSHNLTKI